MLKHKPVKFVLKIYAQMLEHKFIEYARPRISDNRRLFPEFSTKRAIKNQFFLGLHDSGIT